MISGPWMLNMKEGVIASSLINKKLPFTLALPSSGIPFRSVWEKLGWIEPHSGPAKTIGLDIGLTSIRTVTVTRYIDRMELEEIRYFPVSGEPLKNLSIELQRAFQDKDFENTRVRAAISGASTLVRYITLPSMSEKELRSALPFEAEKYIPYQINEVVMGCHLLTNSKDEKGRKQIKGILAVCKKDAVNNLCQTCQTIGAPLAIIDAPPLAIINAFQFNVPETAEQVVALLHIGFNTSNLSILLKGEPVFTREISYGGTDVTQAIVKSTGLSPDEAEKRKINFNWERDKDLQATLEKSLRFLVQEVRLSFNYFENHVPGAEAPEKLFLSGAASRIDHLQELLQKELNTPADYWDPTKRLTIAPSVDRAALDKLKSGMIIGIGLAIR